MEVLQAAQSIPGGDGTGGKGELGLLIIAGGNLDDLSGTGGDFDSFTIGLVQLPFAHGCWTVFRFLETGGGGEIDDLEDCEYILY